MAKRILIVDDDKTLLVWMSEALLKKDYEVDVAINGTIALEKIKAHKPDLIITDVLMPQMDGFQFFKEVKKNKDTANILFLVQTGRKMMEDSFAGLGVTEFLSKPCKPDDLYAKVDAIIARLGLEAAPEVKPLQETLSSVASKSWEKGQVELTAAQKNQLDKNYVRAGVIFSIVILLISIGVFFSSKSFVDASKGHAVGSRLLGPTGDDAPIHGEFSDYDIEKKQETVTFYDHGVLKWRKIYDDDGRLLSEENL